MTDVHAALAAATRRVGERIDAELLLLHLLGKPRSWLYAHAGDALPAGVEVAFDALLARREAGEPIAYITGRRGFWSLDLEVTPATLIPRPETERLVELVLERLPRNAPCRVADLGTGSGAIALSLARELPRAQVVATDASAAALAVAERNARRLGIANASFVEGDWLAPLAGQRFDLIASNPPYIESDDPHLARGDLRFEPATALASGGDGLDDIRRIVVDAIPCLRPGGWLLFEHGWTQADAVAAILLEAGFGAIATRHDIEGRARCTGGVLGA